MSGYEKNRDLILAWEALLKGLRVKLSWTPNTNELYSTPALSLACEKKTDRQVIEDLTPRERQVLEWVLKGKSSREIAVVLSVSFRTVEKHVQSIYRKTGIRGRSDLFNAFLPQDYKKEHVVFSSLAYRKKVGRRTSDKTHMGGKERI